MTTDQIKETLAKLDRDMRACIAVSPSNLPALVRESCTCPTCKPQRGRG
ncbi:hypothetical protein ACWEPC_01995 [Nonomuraea sp. NPDC004297]